MVLSALEPYSAIKPTIIITSDHTVCYYCTVHVPH